MMFATDQSEEEVLYFKLLPLTPKLSNKTNNSINFKYYEKSVQRNRLYLHLPFWKCKIDMDKG